MDHLLLNSIANSTRQAYSNSLSKFFNFRAQNGFGNSWPAPLIDIICFIAHAFKCGFSHSSINGYLAGISFFSKINDLSDNTQKFVVRKMLEGFKRSRGCNQDSRLPITKELLKSLILILPNVCSSQYEVKLFSAIFSLCFHAFLRVGEVAISNKNNEHVLDFHNLLVFPNSLQLYIASSKTDQTGQGTYLTVQAQQDLSLCPVKLLKDYISERSNHAGPLFCHFDKSPMSRYQISAVLSKGLQKLGIPKMHYSTHSFRIGAASTYSMLGYTDEAIMSLGRWKSNSYKRYIRIP